MQGQCPPQGGPYQEQQITAPHTTDEHCADAKQAADSPQASNSFAEGQTETPCQKLITCKNDRRKAVAVFLPMQVACYLVGQLDNNLIKEDTAATILSTSPIEGLVQQCAIRATNAQTWTLRELDKSVQLNPASVVGRWSATAAFLYVKPIAVRLYVPLPPNKSLS